MLISDAERDQAAGRLQVAVSEGRLTLEQFSDRVGAVYSADTRGELRGLLADLPAEQPTATSPRDEPLPPARGAPEHIVPFGSVKRTGRWRLAENTELGVVFGSVKLDLRGAQITAPEVEVTALAVFGTVKVWVPQGLRVEVEGGTVFGSRRIEENHLPSQPDVPVLRLKLDTVFGTVKVYVV